MAEVITKWLLHIHEDLEQLHWLPLNKQGNAIGSCESGTWNDLPSIDVACTVTVLLPGTWVGQYLITLPKMPHSKLIQAVPFTLEDQLVQDVNQLHFAIGTPNEENEVPVRVIDKEQLERCLSTLTEHNIHPSNVISENDVVPLHEDAWSIFVGKKTALIRSSTAQGYAVDVENLITLLKALVKETSELPTRLHIYPNDGVTVSKTMFDSIALPVEDHKPEFLLLRAKQSLAEKRYITLLQGAYRTTHRLMKLKKRWVAAGIIAGVWAFIFVAGNIGQYVYMSVQNHGLNAQIKVIYNKYFPNQAVEEPRFRLQNKLQSLIKAASGSEFLRILGKAGPSIQQSPRVNISTLRYENNQLRLSVNAPTFSVLQTFQQNLVGVGLNVKQSQAGTKDKAVTANLTITEPSS